MKPVVLVLTPDYPPAYGGIQRLMARLVENWRRCDVQVVTIGALVNDRSVVRRVRRPRVGGQVAANLLLNAVSVREAVRRRPDVVFSGHIVASPGARVIRRLTGARYVQYVHGREIPARPWLASSALAAADVVIANSRYTEELARSHGARTVRRIPPGVDESAPSSGERFATPTVVTVARLDGWYKGHDVLLRAMPLIRARVDGTRLIIVGDGRLRDAYQGLTHALALDGAVEFRRAVTDDERDELVSRSHVFAMPSRISASGGAEGFGIVYLEANAHGLPVVAGNVAGAVDAVEDGVTGVLVEPTDPVAVADAITGLLLDPARAEALGRAGAERARGFAWPRVAARVEDVLLSVAREPA